MAGEWTESLHPRADDGKFGSGSGQARSTKATATLRAVKAAGGVKAVRVAKAPKPPKVPKIKPPKFDPTAHNARIAGLRTKEAKIRAHGLVLKGHMAALKTDAKAAKSRGASKATLARMKAEHAMFKEQHATVRAMAAEAKTARVQAGKDMRQAKQDHNAKHGIGRRKVGQTVAPPPTPIRAPLAAKPAPVTAKVAVKPSLPSTELKLPTPLAVNKMAGNDPLRRVIASQYVEVDDPDKNSPLPPGEMHYQQFTAHAMAAIRTHHNQIYAAYGMHNNDKGKEYDSRVFTRTPLGFGGHETALGVHWSHNGEISLAIGQSELVNAHANLSASGLRSLGRDHLEGDERSSQLLDAYSTITHEALHGHGPELADGKHYTFVDELTTETATRKIVGDIHGQHVHDVTGSYNSYIVPTVSKLAELSGRPQREATDALARASIWHKKRSDTELDPDVAMHDLAKVALGYLGKSDQATHHELVSHMQAISEAG